MTTYTDVFTRWSNVESAQVYDHNWKYIGPEYYFVSVPPDIKAARTAFTSYVQDIDTHSLAEEWRFAFNDTCTALNALCGMVMIIAFAALDTRLLVEAAGGPEAGDTLSNLLADLTTGPGE